MQEYLSSAKAKQVEGRKERGEAKRSKPRGGVERGRNVPDKSIEHERWYLQSLAEWSETSFPPVSEMCMACMPHRVSVNQTRCEAAGDPSRLRVR